MGVYINTFRTDHRMALFNGQRIPVYAYRYLCNLRDADDDWGRRTRSAALWQSHMQRARDRFVERKPALVTHVYEDRWNGTEVYANPSGDGVWYDCDSFPGTLVGYLKQVGRGYTVVTERAGHDEPMVGNHKVTRFFVDRVSDGKHTREIQYCIVDGKRMTPEEFAPWKEQATAEYVAEYRKQQAEAQVRQERAAAERQARIADKDAEIAEARRRLQELEQQRNIL